MITVFFKKTPAIYYKPEEATEALRALEAALDEFIHTKQFPMNSIHIGPYAPTNFTTAVSFNFGPNPNMESILAVMVPLAEACFAMRMHSKGYTGESAALLRRCQMLGSQNALILWDWLRDGDLTLTSLSLFLARTRQLLEGLPEYELVPVKDRGDWEVGLDSAAIAAMGAQLRLGLLKQGYTEETAPVQQEGGQS